MPPPIRNQPGQFHYHTYDFGGAAAWTLSAPVVTRNNYCFYSMVQDLTGLQVTAVANGVPNPVLVNLGTVHENGVNRDVLGLSFGGPVPAPVAPPTPAAVITGGIHAREWVAPEIAYLVAEYLIINYTTAANVPAPTANQLTLRNLVDSRRIHIIPMLNPHGNDYTVFDPSVAARDWRKNRRALPTTGALWDVALTNGWGVANPPFQNVNVSPAGVCTYNVPDYDTSNGFPPPAPNWRTRTPANNAIGVDLNRNYHTPAWGYDCDPWFDNWDPNSTSYFGNEVASEVETGHVEVFLAGTAGVETAIDYHSYSKFILYPTEAFNSGAVNANYRNLGNILQRLIAPGWLFYDYSLGTPRQLVGYDVTGSICDHIAMQMPGGVRAFTIELDPSTDNPGFQLPEDQIQAVFEKNIRAALALMVAAGQPSTLSNNWFFGRTITSGERVFLAWNTAGHGNQLP